MIKIRPRQAAPGGKANLLPRTKAASQRASHLHSSATALSPRAARSPTPRPQLIKDLGHPLHAGLVLSTVVRTCVTRQTAPPRLVRHQAHHRSPPTAPVSTTTGWACVQHYFHMCGYYSAKDNDPHPSKKVGECKPLNISIFSRQPTPEVNIN